jgi:iduronate 2-sulfatase
MQNNTSSVKEFSVSQYPRKLSKEEMQKAGYDSNKMMGYSLRTNQYRLTIWMNDFTTSQPFDAKKVFASEMYDYKADPLEKVNIYKTDKYKDVAKDMYDRMIAFFKSQEKK